MLHYTLIRGGTSGESTYNKRKKYFQKLCKTYVSLLFNLLILTDFDTILDYEILISQQTYL